MRISKNDNVTILVDPKESEAVFIAARNLENDLRKTLGVKTKGPEGQNGHHRSSYVIYIESGHTELPCEGFRITAAGKALSIFGADRRGAIYGIYTLSEMLGVSPWYFFADVPPKEKKFFEIQDGVVKEDAPTIPIRGIFINDEEELEAWVKNYMEEPTIGVKTYEKVYELLLRLKLNYLWPAMHVNSFNMNVENGRLAEKMGIIIGTSHCDMLMRSNNREWIPWLQRKGYEAEYDYSIPGRNRDILKEYWSESIQQNRDFEVSYTLGMRGIHDSGFVTKELAGLEGEELLNAKTKLLEEVIRTQRQMLKDTLGEEKDSKAVKTFIPYKEVLSLYDNNLNIPEDITLIWVNDNYGYVRRYPSEKEKRRIGGNGLYYHNSYWSPPGNSYMFITSIPLAHTKNELLKAYENGIQKLWICNFGCIKPLEEQVSYFADLAWSVGKGEESVAVRSVDEWVKEWLMKTFTLSSDDADWMARSLNDFDQIVNVRKVEHLTSDVFPLYSYGDEGAHRIRLLDTIMQSSARIEATLPQKEKDAFFEMVSMKLQAAFYSSCMFYYGDRSRLCIDRGSFSAAEYYTYLANEYEKIRRKMLYYYNHVIADGKWNGILTPEDFPPPRTAIFPECKQPLSIPEPGLVVNVWGSGEPAPITFSGKNTKWIEVSNAGEGELQLIITCPNEFLIYGDGVSGGRVDENISVYKTSVGFEKRIFVDNTYNGRFEGTMFVSCPQTKENIPVTLISKPMDNGEDDGRIILEASEFNRSEGSVSIIERLGRDHGPLCQLDDRGSSVTYRFKLLEDGDVHILVHRFPSLNSTGRIRCVLQVDNDARTLESLSNDEHKAAWKTNVQNNVDLAIADDFKLSKGEHILRLSAVDRYFAFSRVFIFTKPAKPMNIGMLTYGEGLPEIYDCHSRAKAMYGRISLPKRPEVFASRKPGDNANTDYDLYAEGEDGIAFSEIIPRSRKTTDYIMSSAGSIFKPKGGFVTIYAAAALSNTKYACIEQEKDYVTWCQSSSFSMTGLALTVSDRSLHFQPDEAPRLVYRFSLSKAGVYTIWLKLFMWGTDESHFEVSVDDRRYTAKDFCTEKLWLFSSENMWKNYPVVMTDLEKGEHTLTLHILDSGLRIDRIVIAPGSDFPEKELYGKTDLR